MRPRQEFFALEVKALYTVGELATASGVDRRTLRLLLVEAGCDLLASGNAYYVSMADLELRARPLWDGIQAAQALLRELQ